MTHAPVIRWENQVMVLRFACLFLRGRLKMEMSAGYNKGCRRGRRLLLEYVSRFLCPFFALNPGAKGYVTCEAARFPLCFTAGQARTRGGKISREERMICIYRA